MRMGVEIKTSDSTLIIRVLRGHVGADRVDSFHERARQALAEVCPDNGCAWAQMGRQVHRDHSEEIVLVTVWRTMDALYDWLGSRDLLHTPIRKGYAELLDTYDVQHYETLEAPVDSDAWVPRSFKHMGI
jgi:heme-degrading monooxygenase HmoA